MPSFGSAIPAPMLTRRHSTGRCAAQSFRPALEALESRALPSFSAPILLPLGGSTSPVALAVADFNGDRKLDIASVNSYFAPGSPRSGSVSILLGDGSGGFSPGPGSPFPAQGLQPTSLALGDFNGDGAADIAVTNVGSNNLGVLLGDGRGGFYPAPGSPQTVGARPQGVAAGDFNGDGRLDLAAANSDGVSVLLGDGRGGFGAAPGSPFSTGSSGTNSVAAGDFNGDGLLDLASVNSGVLDTASVLLGDGQGQFRPAPGSPFSTGGTFARSVAVGDFNGDGRLDVATTNGGGTPNLAGNVSILLGSGSGCLALAPGFPFVGGGASPIAVATGDFNSDGRRDLASANSASNDLSVLLGDGRGTLAPAAGSPYSVGGGDPLAIAVADFNGDGRLDVATANSSSNDVSILLGLSPNQAFVTQVYLGLLGRPADVNGLAHWEAWLNRGASHAQIANAIQGSAEYRDHLMRTLYAAYLGRAADDPGLATHVGALARGVPVDAVRASLLGSEEYFRRQGSTSEGFLTGLYRDVLGRSLDPSGQASWGALMAAGMTRAEVSYRILNSVEGLSAKVGGYYRQFLGREADANGLVNFVSQIQGGASDRLVIAALLGSAEYQART